MSQQHWENVYTSKSSELLSWYQDQPTVSLKLIEASGIAKNEPIIDVGGGASRLVDTLLSRKFNNITVLDISPSAIAQAKRRLGERSNSVL